MQESGLISRGGGTLTECLSLVPRPSKKDWEPTWTAWMIDSTQMHRAMYNTTRHTQGSQSNRLTMFYNTTRHTQGSQSNRLTMYSTSCNVYVHVYISQSELLSATTVHVAHTMHMNIICVHAYTCI